MLQQVAAPQELYRRPANLFVASFIGSPPMNLIDATLERSGAADQTADQAAPPSLRKADGAAGGACDTGPVVVFGSCRVPVPAQVVKEHPALDRFLGEQIVVGIRPEHMTDAALAADAASGAAAGGRPVIELPIRLREELGSEVYLHAGIGGAAHVSGEADDVRSLATIVAKVDPRTQIAEGQTAPIAVDATELQFFDPATGACLRG